MSAKIISGEIDAAVDARQAVTLQATAIDLSQHVRTRVKNASVIPFAKFKRAFVGLDQNKIRFCVEDDLFGLPIFSSIEFEPKVSPDGKVVAKKTGLRIGSLGIPPEITQLDSLFKKFQTGLKHEQKLLEKASAIQITKDYAVLVTKP